MLSKSKIWDPWCDWLDNLTKVVKIKLKLDLKPWLFHLMFVSFFSLSYRWCHMQSETMPLVKRYIEPCLVNLQWGYQRIGRGSNQHPAPSYQTIVKSWFLDGQKTSHWSRATLTSACYSYWCFLPSKFIRGRGWITVAMDVLVRQLGSLGWIVKDIWKVF